MNAALRRGVVSGIFAGGIVILGVATATSASADTGDPGPAPAGSTNGSDGIGWVNQTVLAPVLPGAVAGNQLTLVGDGEDDPGVDPGDGDGDGGGDDPSVSPGGQDGGDVSPGDIDVLPGQARAGSVVTAPRAPREVQAGLRPTATTGAAEPGVLPPGQPRTPWLPLLMMLTGLLCLAPAGRRYLTART